MAWDTVLPVMVRHLIDDVNDTQTYNDERVNMSILTAAILATQDYDFPTAYTVDFCAIDISPDPTAEATLDVAAIALFSLKAACILNFNKYQGSLADGIKVRDGDSEVDTTGAFGGYRDIIILGPCASYDRMLTKLSTLRSMNLGKAVVSPFSHEDLTQGQGGSTAGFFDSFWIGRP